MRGIDFLNKCQLFEQRWSQIARQAIDSKKLSLVIECLPPCGDFDGPLELIECFLRSIEGTDRQSGISASDDASNQAAAWMLLCNAAIAARRHDDIIEQLLTTVSGLSIPDHSKARCLQTLASLIILQTKGFEDRDRVATLVHAHLKCSRAEVSAALTLLMALGSCHREIPALHPRTLQTCMQQILPRCRSMKSANTIFNLARLLYLAQNQQTREYDYLLRRLKLKPGPLAKLCVEIATDLARKFPNSEHPGRRQILQDGWHEQFRPGIILASASSSMHVSNEVKQTAPFEFTTRIINAKQFDPDVLTARYIQLLRNALADLEYAPLTFLTSIFRGRQWLEGFLQNMTSLQQFDQATLLMLNAASPECQEETALIRTFQQRWPNIIHIRLEQDPGLYNIWNIGASISGSEYLSNANLDDRKSNDFIPAHLDGFHSSEHDISLVSSPCYICAKPNTSFEQYETLDGSQKLAYYFSPQYYGYADMFLDYWLPNEQANVVWRNIPHCMPVWKRKLHQEFGLFDEQLGGPAADLEFWLRCAAAGKTFHNLNTPKGLYYFSDSTTYSARNQQRLELISELHIKDQSTANLGMRSLIQRAT